ncbi:hypothetical protein RV11_GL003389 [Enterococcus phoeniculicola]|nr:hypothetical protein RV11_GL003389 [Enterococcus phoeniculicola]
MSPSFISKDVDSSADKNASSPLIYILTYNTTFSVKEKMTG